MNFVHIADVHLGAQPEAGTAYSAGRPQELWDTFSRVIEYCETEKVDILLVAGDLFHRQPLLRELKEVNYLFSTLTYTQVVFIAGNHDYVKKDAFYRTFQWNSNVHPLLGREIGYVNIPESDLVVYGASYQTREIREELPSIKAPGRAAFEILLLHGGDEKHLPMKREVLENSGFSYIALGHIHKPQALVKGIAFYPGALEPVDKNDTGRHGFLRGQFTGHGVRTEFIPFAKREYLHLPIQVDDSTTNGSLKNLIKETIEETGVENIYKFILQGYRDPDVVFDTEYMDICGNILEIVDETKLAFNYERLYEENKDNLIGRFIAEFRGCEEGSVEYQALQEGVWALLNL